jgi:hypothetical protein
VALAVAPEAEAAAGRSNALDTSMERCGVVLLSALSGAALSPCVVPASDPRLSARPGRLGGATPLEHELPIRRDWHCSVCGVAFHRRATGDVTLRVPLHAERGSYQATAEAVIFLAHPLPASCDCHPSPGAPQLAHLDNRTVGWGRCRSGHRSPQQDTNVG